MLIGNKCIDDIMGVSRVCFAEIMKAEMVTDSGGLQLSEGQWWKKKWNMWWRMLMDLW